jgi:hypothetical protein
MQRLGSRFEEASLIAADSLETVQFFKFIRPNFQAGV